MPVGERIGDLIGQLLGDPIRPDSPAAGGVISAPSPPRPPMQRASAPVAVR
jgi:hypothetical protein